MSSMIVKPPDDEHAYEQIEAAVMETSRGRQFLAEYARRNRHAETVTVLAAIEKLQGSLGTRSGFMMPSERLQNEILEMARAIAQTERDIRAIRPEGAAASQYASASDELDAVVGTTEQATSSILGAAEKVQEYAWTMRERSGNEAECDLLDACATEIYTACGFQDITAQRIHKVVGTLRFLDQRIKSMLEATGLAEDFHADEKMIGELTEPEPVVRSSDIWMSDVSQAEIDDTFDFFVPAALAEPTMVEADLYGGSAEAEIEAPEPVSEKPATAKPAASKSASAKATAKANPLAPPPPAASAYDGLTTEEKLRAFR
jgi:chemotaxis protein CheZ